MRPFLALAIAARVWLGAGVGARAADGVAVDLGTLARRHGWAPRPAADGELVSALGLRSLRLRSDSRSVLIDGVIVYLNAPAAGRGGGLWLARADAHRVISPLLAPTAALADAPAARVMLDPGHGGSDCGAIGHRRVVEKKVNLDIARRVRRKLLACQAAVFMTRDADVYLGLDERCRLARSAGADLFVSIHANSGRQSASGFETFVLASPGFAGTHGQGWVDRRSYPGNAHDPANAALGFFIQKGILSCAGGVDRGVKRSRFAVLRSAPCPAALVECGFVSNGGDVEKLLNPGFRDNIATGIARGVLTYISRAEEGRAAIDSAGRAGHSPGSPR